MVKVKPTYSVYEVYDYKGELQHSISDEYKDEWVNYIRIWSNDGDLKHYAHRHTPFRFTSASSGNVYYSHQMGILLKSLVESLFI